MNVKTSTLALGLVAMQVTLPLAWAVKEHREQPAGTGVAALWRNPADIQSRNLFYGPGGSKDQPRGPYTFIKEDLKGTNPKFVIRDAAGVKWKVKLGIEARPETVAARLIWSIGYYANEDYFLHDLRVSNMPAHLHRGQKLIAADGSIYNVRLKREDEKKLGDWQWRDDPFTGSREWNGLRVMMAVINNWDLKDLNNSIYERPGSERVYMVSDLGASFGSGGPRWPLWKAKGNLDYYARSKFIERENASTVDFYVPGRPQFVWLVHFRGYFQRLHLRWIGRRIPRTDDRWIARQIQDAFRAAGYSLDC